MKAKDVVALIAALDELAAVAEGAAMLAELAETESELRKRLPLIVGGICKQLAAQLTALASQVDEGRK